MAEALSVTGTTKIPMKTAKKHQKTTFRLSGGGQATNHYRKPQKITFCAAGVTSSGNHNHSTPYSGT